MLDGLLGRGFSSKCKSLIKPTRTRIDVLRKRKEATQRFLKGNLAQLLSNGHDTNAYGRSYPGLNYWDYARLEVEPSMCFFCDFKDNLLLRLGSSLCFPLCEEVKQTEEFLAGQNLLSCYDFIELSCEHILKQHSVIQKQRECPEECRVAVGSLMFAAARFSDLPELRELRDTFHERYGSSLEIFVNQKFVEKLALKPPTMEKKLQLLQDIALEFSIEWDARGFEQRISNPWDQPKQYGYIHDNDDKFNYHNSKETVVKTDKQNQTSNESTEPSKDRHRAHNGMADNLLKRDELELTDDKNKPLTGREQSIRRRDNYGIPVRGRQEFTEDNQELSHGKKDTTLETVRLGRSSRGRRPEFVDSGYEVHNDRISSIPKRDSQNPLADGKPENAARVTRVPIQQDGEDISSASNSHYGHRDMGVSRSKVQEEETDKLKPYSSNSLPPPYLKAKDKLVPPPYTKLKDSKYGANAEAKHANSDFDGTSMYSSIHKSNNVVCGQERRIQGELDHPNYGDQVVVPTLVGWHDHENDIPYRNEIPLPRPRASRRKHSKSSSNRNDPGDSEDAEFVKRSSSSRRRDNSRPGTELLSDNGHYRKDEEERMIDKLLLHYSKKPSTFEPERVKRESKPDASRHYNRDGHDMKAETVPPPPRSISLPHEPTAPTEAVKVFPRANSFQPYNPTQHVHPKLPDYDDLAARFAALKGGREG
ncbi:regulator of Vps4 activity in the MVB pathway protein [Actinidia rufa]|uniref:Regulator of Vps4 activity in the MVB pathway protein n=1 Tax=Actinidia rufa TaxID=165716 RepID=A0A7J0FEI5_9ERIC|nr:regulator of Vps4 activity in the MVB pathway protein [Actinidia rufa]